MKRNVIRILAAFFLVVIAGQSLGAIDVEATAPKTGFDPLDDAVQEVIDALVAEANKDLAKFGNQPLLAQGFGNANVYVTQVAAQHARQDYRFLAVTLGTMMGAQLPAFTPSELQNAFEDLEKEGDLFLGAAWQLWSLQFGLNAGFLIDNLHLGFKIGKLSLEDVPGMEGFSFNSLNLGVTASYQLFKERSLLGLIKWRGLSVGSGLIVQNTKTLFELSLPQLEQELIETGIPGFGDFSGTITLDPSLEVGTRASSLTIPIEAFTGLRLLFLLELTLGAGIDLSFGSSEIILRALGVTGIDVEAADLPLEDVITPGEVVIDAGTEDNPSFMRPRIFAGVGFNLGPVMLEIPLTWYLTSGFSVGLTLGIVL